MTLQIGMSTPDRALEKTPIDQAIIKLAEQVAREKLLQRLPAGPTLDITFLLSTKDEKPSFTGMMMGGYTPENSTLFFKTAVPERITHSNAAPLYVSTVLEDVIDNASAFFHENATPFAAEEWRLALSRLNLN